MATLTIKFTDKELEKLGAQIAAHVGSGSDAGETTKPARASKKAEEAKEDDDLDDGLGDEDDGDGDADDVTIEDVRKALKEYASIEGKPAAIEIIQKVGKADSLAELKKAKFAAVVAACDA